MIEFKAVKVLKRSQYTAKYLKQPFLKTHRSLELDALDEARKKTKEPKYPLSSRYGRHKRPAIRRVNLNDIRWFDDVGYTLTYCIFDDWRLSAIPVQVKCRTWKEIYQAYIEAMKIQMKQGIIKRR